MMNVRQEGYGYINKASEVDILFLDDLGAEYKTDYGLNALNEIFNRRLGKWTFITYNLSLQYIYNDFDGRIASRMMRGNNEIIQTDAIDYNLRKNRFNDTSS